MRSNRFVWVARVALVALLLSPGAVLANPPSVAGDKPTRIKSPSTLRTDRGTERRLPPGTFFPDPVFEKLDTEVRRLQDQETRLTAENKSLKESAEPGFRGWFVAVGIGLAAGIGAGYVAFH